MTWLLLPGLRLVRRDADHLQLGVDAPRVAVLPDTRAVRRLVADLAHGGPLTTLDDDDRRPCWPSWSRAGLVVAADDEAGRRAAPRAVRGARGRPRRRAARGAAAGPARPAWPPRPIAAAATVALVWSEGELARDRLDGWVRAGTPHLVVAELSDGPRLGPFVVPGATACLRCVDAHAGEADPRRALVVEQVATAAPLRPARPDLGAADARPGLGGARPRHGRRGRPAEHLVGHGRASTRCRRSVTAYRRHPHCGCAWADDGRCAASLTGRRLTSTRCRACPPSRAGARASSASQ